MRYTTIIDISELQAVYRSYNARLLYLHLVLKSGWHEQDRDQIEISIRKLAMQTGISISAARHALQLLQKAGLLTRNGSTWDVKKWILEEKPRPRAKTAAQAKERAIADTREERQHQQDAALDKQRKEREQLHAQGKTSYMVFYEMKMEQAAAGDIDAQEFCRKNRAAYDAQVDAIKKVREKETK